MLGGFYHNVFEQLRPLYAEWAEVSPATAIPFKDAFRGHNAFTLMQPDGNDWRAVRVTLPTNDLTPGVNPETITPAEILGRILEWLGVALRKVAMGHAPALWIQSVEGWEAPPRSLHLDALADRSEALTADLPTAAPGAARPPAAGDLLDRIGLHARDVQSTMQTLGEGAPPAGPDWIGVLELIATIARGFAADRLAELGFDTINDIDASAWLRRHGGSDRAVSCPLMQAGYHYSFAFEDGDWRRPNIAAGVGIRGLLRMVFAYHGSVFMHMVGGMGEVIAAPYYEVLRARGVRFHFFHRVEGLVPGADGRLAEVRVRVQANPIDGADAYRPLIEHPVGDDARVRRAFPEEPLFDQLGDADAARGARGSREVAGQRRLRRPENARSRTGLRSLRCGHVHRHAAGDCSSPRRRFAGVEDHARQRRCHPHHRRPDLAAGTCRDLPRRAPRWSDDGICRAP